MRARYTIQQKTVLLSSERPVRIARVELGHGVPPHDHSYSELTIIIAGQVEHRTSSGKESLGAGAVIVMPPGACHAFFAPRNLVLYNLYFLAEWLAGDLGQLRDEPAALSLFFQDHLFSRSEKPSAHIGHLETDDFASVQESLISLEREISRARRRRETVLRLSLLRLLVLSSRAFGPDATVLRRRETQRAVTLIEQALWEGTPPVLSDLARRCGLSSHHFARLFRAESGLSPWAYIQQRRAEYAARLLLDPSLSATEIAHRLHFTDSSHFTRSFKHHKGCTPSEFRQTFATAQITA